MAKDQEKALDVIGHKLRIKEEIDKDFDEFEVVLETPEIDEPDTNLKIQNLNYTFNNKDFGLNVFANLNLGKAYKIEGEGEGEYNIPPDAKRVKFSIDDKEALDEAWLDYLIDKVSSANSSFIILENIFTRATTGNYKDVLPYKEQLRFAYQKFSDPRLKGKFIGLVRGINEEEIIKYGGPDLMLKLGKLLGIENRVVSSPSFNIELKDNVCKDKKNVSIICVNQKTTATKGIFRIMQEFEKTQPGFDIYYNTTGKQNGISAGLTTALDKNGRVIKKPCWFICFGPMFEYDKANINRPSLEPYVPNKAWYKVGFSHKIDGGKVTSAVRVDYQDYIYPIKVKTDFSNFTSAVISDHVEEVLRDYKEKADELMDKTIENVTLKNRKGLNTFIKYGKEK